MHSALAGDDTGGRWSDKKKEGGGWNEKRSTSRWREDEREGTRSAARGGGWGASNGNFDAGGGGRWNRDRGGRDRRDAGFTAGAGAGFQSDVGGPGGWNDPVPVPGAGAKREPARPAGRGFSMGRGRGAGGFGGAGVGAGVGASAAGFLDGLPRRAPPRVKDGQGFVSALSGGIPPAPNFADAPVRHGPVRYKYSANDLLGRLGQLRAATGGTLPLPSAVDPDSVPLRTVKPGDQMWELTVEGARAARAGREWVGEGGIGAPPAPTPRGAAAETTPEWSLESAGSVKSLGPGFLGGGAVPRLTAEEEARFNPATQPSWLTEGGKAPNGADLMGALESESDNTNRGGGVEDAQQHAQQRAQQQPPGGAGGAGGGVPSQPMGPVTDAPWLYTDPSGTVQGPFQRAELIEWHESGYFPPDLPLRPADAPPSMPFVPLKEMLVCGWRYPGPRVAAQMQQEQQMREQQMREQQMREQQMREQQMREQQMREQQMREQQMREQQMREQQMREQQMREQEAREQQAREQQAREQQMREQQMLEHQQQLQQQQQQRVGLETLFGVGGGASPPSQPNLLANLFGSAPQGASMGGARVPPPPGGEMMSLEDLERSMAAGGGGGSGLPPAPQPGSFDAPAAPWGGAGVDRPPLEDSGWISAPPPAGHQHAAQQQQQQQRPFEQVPASPPSKPAWGGAASNDGGAGGGKSLAEIQAEEEERAAARQRELDARAKTNPGLGGGPMATAWGGAGAGGGPSLAQIQAEELRRSRELEERRRAEQARQAAAAPAGVGPGGPGLGAWGKRPSSVAQPPPQQQQPPQQQPPRLPPREASAGFWDSLPPASGASPAAGGGGGARKPAPGGAVAPLNAPSRAAEASPRPTNAAGFKEWCRAEMLALNGSDDTTLVDFLVSLPSAGEVSEYVQLYLGDDERAAAFGNELIRIKRTNPQIISGGGAAGGDFAGGDDGWEGGGKKGRRGKK